jgi:ATP-dependent DNA ligase
MTWTFQQFTPPGARGSFKQELMKDSNWWAEEKYDGDRRIAQFLVEGVRFTGRRVSKVDGFLVEKTDNLPQLNGRAAGTLGFQCVPLSLLGTVLDGEIVCADPLARSRDVTSIMGSAPSVAIKKQQERGWLRFAAFDCLFYKGTDMRGMPLHARRIALDHVMAEWNNPYAFAVPFRDDKEALLEEVWSRGGEGIILKNSSAPYGIEREWVKVKREVTYDVVLMGFEAAKEVSVKVDGSVSATKYAGMVGAARFGQHRAIGLEFQDGDGGPLGVQVVTRLIECGQCSGFDDATRADMTAHPEKYVGRAFEITAQLREPSGSFRHPRFSRWRDDKNPEQCIWGQQ